MPNSKRFFMTNITEDKDKWTNVGVPLFEDFTRVGIPLFEDLFKGGITNTQVNLIYGKSRGNSKWKRKYRISKIIKILNII